MKKYLKNIMISFLVIFFMLSFLNLIYQLIQQYFVIIPAMTELAESVKHTGILSEDSYQMIASAWYMGYGNKNEIQIQIILISILVSVAIGLIVALKEKSKLKRK